MESCYIDLLPEILFQQINLNQVIIFCQSFQGNFINFPDDLVRCS